MLCTWVYQMVGTNVNQAHIHGTDVQAITSEWLILNKLFKSTMLNGQLVKQRDSIGQPLCAQHLAVTNFRHHHLRQLHATTKGGAQHPHRHCLAAKPSSIPGCFRVSNALSGRLAYQRRLYQRIQDPLFIRCTVQRLGGNTTGDLKILRQPDLLD